MVKRLLAALQTFSLKQAVFILLFFAVVLNLALYLWRGFIFTSDAYAYLEMRELPLSQLPRHYLSYSAFIIFLKFALTFTKSTTLIFVIQTSISIVALLSLYQATLNFTRNKAAALLTGLIFLFYFKISQWNFYLLPESIYTSFICLHLLLLSYFHRRKTTFSLILALGNALVISFIKPTGFVLAAGTLVYFLWFKKVLILSRPWLAAFILSLLTFSLYVTANLLLTTFVHSILYSDFSKGEIVFRASQLSHVAGMQDTIVTRPESLWYPPQHYPPIIQLLLFVIENPVYFFKVWGLKLGYFLSHTRPYFSWANNLFSFLVLFPAYLIAGISLKTSNITQPLKAFSITYFILHLGIISFTTIDQEGRFLIPLLPVVFMLTGNGLIKVWLKHRG